MTNIQFKIFIIFPTHRRLTYKLLSYSFSSFPIRKHAHNSSIHSPTHFHFILMCHHLHHEIVFQKGLKLPGSRKDIIRTQKISGPSPVGGAAGGTEGRVKMSLDEFELQAAHYNIACALARLGRVSEVSVMSKASSKMRKMYVFAVKQMSGKEKI